MRASEGVIPVFDSYTGGLKTQQYLAQGLANKEHKDI